MFQPNSGRLRGLAERLPKRIQELENVFSFKTNVYIDYANIRPWSTKLGWHIDEKRLKQFLNSFQTIQSVKFYNGTLAGDPVSEDFARKIRSLGYEMKTKPVKIMKLSIDVSSIPLNSPAILKDFIRKPLLQKLTIEGIEFLNKQLLELNRQGTLFLEDKKCNFDVEIGRDMLVDYSQNSIEHFALWSGDSDFADPVRQLLLDRKRVTLFATARRISSELNELVSKGLRIFDIQKIRNFICWKKEFEE